MFPHFTNSYFKSDLLYHIVTLYTIVNINGKNFYFWWNFGKNILDRRSKSVLLLIKLKSTDGRKMRRRKMTYADLFYEIKGKFMGADVSDIKEHLAYQFSIEDEEAGGAFYVEVKDGQLFVEPYEYYDRDAMFICSPDTLFKIADGKLDPVLAFTMQKLRVEGNIDKALKLKDIIEKKQAQLKEERKAAKAAEKAEKKAEKQQAKDKKSAKK